MEQHAVPQQISSYQFRLVGDMTLKQFFQLAGGVLIGLLIYATGLPGLIKWPLIIFFSLFGAALAFLPFEERPLSQWILAFFRSVYSPTIFSWNQTPGITYFQPEPQETPKKPKPAETGLIRTKDHPSGSILSSLESAEESFLSKITDLFKVNEKVPTPVPAPTAQATTQPATQPAQPVGVKIPQTPLIQTTPPSQTPRPQIVIEEQIPAQPQPPTTLPASPVSQTLPEQQVQRVATAQFSDQAAPPMPPSQPDTITGQVMDPEGGIVEGAILEVRDIAGRPVRALKTNKVGHFMIVTPLLAGKYELVTEKEGLVFEPITFTAEGKTIPPIAIRAKTRERGTHEA
jgi:hypothetical protein